VKSYIFCVSDFRHKKNGGRAARGGGGCCGIDFGDGSMHRMDLDSVSHSSEAFNALIFNVETEWFTEHICVSYWFGTMTGRKGGDWYPFRANRNVHDRNAVRWFCWASNIHRSAQKKSIHDTTNKQTNSVAPYSTSELYRPSYRHLSTKFSTNFCG
jgi:hypothetical protein